jgi:ribosomal protein S18 acetylase RimI-like enzyme
MKAISLNNQAVQVEQSAKWNNLYPRMKQLGIPKFTWVALRYLLRQILRIDWTREILFERPLEEPIQEVVPKIKVRIEQATEDDLDKFKGIVDEDKYNRFQQRFRKGRICFVALDGDKVAAYSWISLDEYDTNRRVELKLNDKEAYFFDDYVIPEYRNNRLQTALYTVRLKYVCIQACDRVVTIIEDTNTYPLKSAKSSGFKPIRTVSIFTIFGLKFQRWQKYTGTLSAENAMTAKPLNNQAIQEENMIKQSRLYSLIKKYGILKLTWLAFRHALRKTMGLNWWREILLERLLEEPIQEIVPKIKVRIEQATKNDLDKFKGIVDKKNYNRFQQRFKKGRICLMALDGDKVAAYSWISLDEYDTNRRVELKLNDKEAYFFDIYVVPEYRNNRLQTALDTVRFKYACSQACDRVVTIIEDTNTYSLKSAKSSGFRPKRSISIFTIFGLEFHRWQKYTGALDH